MLISETNFRLILIAHGMRGHGKSKLHPKLRSLEGGKRELEWRKTMTSLRKFNIR